MSIITPRQKPITDAERLEWLIENSCGQIECVENIAGNIERYFVDLSRDAIDEEILKQNS